MMRYDLNRKDGILGLFLLGIGFACYPAYLVFTLEGGLGNLESALVFAIIGGISLALGFVMLILNAKAVKSGENKEKPDPHVDMLVQILLGVTLLILVISMIVANI